MSPCIYFLLIAPFTFLGGFYLHSRIAKVERSAWLEAKRKQEQGRIRRDNEESERLSSLHHHITDGSLQYVSAQRALEFFPITTMEDAGYDYDSGWYLINAPTETRELAFKLGASLRRSPVDDKIYRIINV